MGLLEPFVGAVDHVDVLGRVLGLEFADVGVPFAQGPLAEDELEGLLVDVVLDAGLPQRRLLAFVGVERVRRWQRQASCGRSALAGR